MFGSGPPLFSHFMRLTSFVHDDSAVQALGHYLATSCNLKIEPISVRLMAAIPFVRFRTITKMEMQRRSFRAQTVTRAE
jgi:hypothetical protein